MDSKGYSCFPTYRTITFGGYFITQGKHNKFLLKKSKWKPSLPPHLTPPPTQPKFQNKTMNELYLIAVA